MHRVILSVVPFVFLVGGCSQAGGGPADPGGDEEFYALFFSEVLERGEEWWGYPPPAAYCIGIAAARSEPSLEGPGDPSEEVLNTLAQANPDKTFYPASSCGGGYPFKAPTGEVAGFLWVEPLKATDRVTLSGGWTARRDMTEWDCTFSERDGEVELEECVKFSES